MNKDRFKFRLPFYNNNGEFSHFQYIDIVDGLKPYNAGVMFHRGEFEQCTGLKDKNGNLIYEGDVVLGSSGFNYKIIWSDMECGWALQNLESKVCIAMNAFTADEIEIIGNIHNPKGTK